MFYGDILSGRGEERLFPFFANCVERYDPLDPITSVTHIRDMFVFPRNVIGEFVHRYGQFSGISLLKNQGGKVGGGGFEFLGHIRYIEFQLVIYGNRLHPWFFRGNTKHTDNFGEHIANGGIIAQLQFTRERTLCHNIAKHVEPLLEVYGDFGIA
jgi:hypothetical protein